jgi:hypothetical protein
VPEPARTAAQIPINLQAQAFDWLGRNWQPLGMGGLILVGLLVLRSTIKPAAPAPQAAAVELPPAETPPVPPDRPAPPLAAASLRAELADTIRQNPQAAAGVLRTWMGTARAGG